MKAFSGIGEGLRMRFCPWPSTTHRIPRCNALAFLRCVLGYGIISLMSVGSCRLIGVGVQPWLVYAFDYRTAKTEDAQ
jgi:hypothetical protein